MIVYLEDIALQKNNVHFFVKGIDRFVFDYKKFHNNQNYNYKYITNYKHIAMTITRILRVYIFFVLLLESSIFFSLRHTKHH